MSPARFTRVLLLFVAIAGTVGAFAAPSNAETPVAKVNPKPFVVTDSAAIFTTRYATLRIDAKGFITSLIATESKIEYSPPAHPSPLLSLHENGQPDETLLAPVSAAFGTTKNVITLTYANGAVAVVKAEIKDTYLRFQLVSLTPRGKVDVVVWGPVNTTISKTLGDIIGVVRDDDFAIGLYGLDDNTITGAVVDGAGRGMGYEAHSTDPEKFPLPATIKEAEKFRIGGDGVSDVAFFSKPEEYFRWIMGTGADLKPEFGTSIAYHSRDRRRSYTYFTSLLPGFELYGNHHMVSDPLPGVDFIGSAVALYACPDDEGLKTIEKITLAEGLPYIKIHGKWIRDPASFSPTVYWNGPMDKAIEYTKALGMKDISRDTGEFYPNIAHKKDQGVSPVGFSNGKTMPFKDFTAEAHKHGLTHGGLHTLCMFLQGGIDINVAPVPSKHLQTVLRTKLAKDISPTDTEIVVTDPSFLAEKGTWPRGADSNYLRIGGEMLRYEGISDNAPWTLKGVKRGHASQAVAHKAGDELVKLMQNCYNGFVPDMALMPDYAEFYAEMMIRNGMDTINFDGFESAMYQQQGYYGVRKFTRHLFETYHKLSGGKWPRVTASCVFAGSWEYLNVCDLGGGNNMFNARSGRRATEGKDIGNAFSASYYPATFGIQGWDPTWTLYDAENLQAKAVGWEATYALSVSQDAIEKTADREAIFEAFRAWQTARAQTAFTKQQKLKLRDPEYKFHLEQKTPTSFLLYSIKELQVPGRGLEAGITSEYDLKNDQQAQPLKFAMFLGEAAQGATITLPDGSRIVCDREIPKSHGIVCTGDRAYLADGNRQKVADLPLMKPAQLPHGESKLGVTFQTDGSKVGFDMTVWIAGEAEKVGK